MKLAKLLMDLAIAGLLVAVSFQGRRETPSPWMEGRPVREWARILTGPPVPGIRISASRLGTNLVPCVLDEVEAYRDHPRDLLTEVFRSLYLNVKWLPELLPPPVSRKERALNGLRLLQQLRANDSRTVAVLISLLEDEDLGCSAVIALGKIGPTAAPAIPKLVDLLDRGDLWTATALGQIGPNAAAIQAMQRGVNNGSPALRLECQEVLKRMARQDY